MCFQVTKEFKFCSAHQLYNSYTKLCSESIHGHNYKVHVTLNSMDGLLDSTDMVIDFTQIKDAFKSFIDDTLDHSLMVPNTLDSEYLDCLTKFNKRILILPYNPTAEKIAKMIYDVFEYELAKITNRVQLKSVKVWETDSSHAEYRR